MSLISGTVTDEAKIYIINEATNKLESAEVHAAGNFEITGLLLSNKVVAAVRTSDKASTSFANVAPIDNSAPMEWDTGTVGSEMVFTQSNTHVRRNSGTLLWSSAFSSLPIPNSGKYYIEFDQFNGPTKVFGLASSRWSPPYTNGNPITLGSVCGHYTNYYSRAYGTVTTSELSGWVSNPIYGMIINRDDNYIKFSKNNTWETINTPIPNNAVTLYLFCALYNLESYMRVNCGQHTFAYAPPSGYTAGISI